MKPSFAVMSAKPVIHGDSVGEVAGELYIPLKGNLECSVKEIGADKKTLVKYQHLFKCPNCSSRLTFFSDENYSGFFCCKCSRVFPVKDGVAIILADEIRNYSLEYPILCDMLFGETRGEIREFLKQTISLVESKKDSRSWEWDDEKFWDEQYGKQANRQEELNRNDRYWQRRPLVETLLKSSSLEDKVILSIGCGDGYNFRKILHPHCDEDSLYIATDISFQGLKLNKSLNPHVNSIYILCSEDYCLPIEDESIDALCYFGVLHHTKQKSMNVEKDKRVLKKGGYVLLHEATDRPESIIAKLFDEEKSAHEEYINKNELLTLFKENKGFEILYKREDSTPFFTLFMILLRKTMLSNKVFFDFIMQADTTLARTIGSLLPAFRAGCIGLTVRAINPCGR